MWISPWVDDLDAQLMAKDSRIVEKRLITGEGVKIGTANADTVNPDESLAGCRKRLRCIRGGKLAGLIERDLEHVGNGRMGGARAEREWNL
jgi:hypothetical protein